MNGRGVAKSDKEAVGWFRKSPAQGDSVAQLRLAHLSPAGSGAASANAEEY